MLVPPTSFGIAEKGVYIASYIDAINFSFLQTLNLKSVLLVDAEKPAPQLYEFLHSNSIQLYQVSHKKPKYETEIDNKYENNVIYIYNDSKIANSSKYDESWLILKRNLISNIFKVVLNKSTYNLLVVDSMVVVISLLRKLQKWSYSSVISEHRLYANKNRTYQIENFLEVCEIELVHEPSVVAPQDVDSLPVIKSSWFEPRRSSFASAWSGDSVGSLVHRSSFVSPDRFGSPDDGSFNSYKEEINEDVASSPKIPNNLVRLMRARKKRGREKEHEEDAVEEQTVGSFSRLAVSPPQNIISPPKSILSQELAIIDQQQLRSPLTVHDDFQQQSDTDDDEEEEEEAAQYYHVFYKSSLKSKYQGINNKIKISLPWEHELPDWFKFHRDLWIEEWRGISGF